MSRIPEILDKCVAKVQKQGKSKSSAFAICTAQLKKAGKLDEAFLAKLDEDEFVNQLEEELMADKKTKPPSFHKFLFQVPELSNDQIQLAEKSKTVRVQCLKAGIFRHQWYGTLRFNSDFFQSMIRNFEADVPQERIAFDFKHNSQDGAAAWVESLEEDGKGLWAEVELTAKGLKAIKEKEFLYFSSEYTEDYIDYKFKEGTDEKGNAVEEETKISHGPTLLGGGLTNRPFLKGMAPVTLSEDGTEYIALEELTEANPNHTSEEVKVDMNEMEKLQKQLEEANARIAELEDAKTKKDKKELSDLQVKVTELEGQIATLSEVPPKGKKLEDPEPKEGDAKQLEEANQKLQEKEAEVRALQEAQAASDAKLEALTGVVTKLQDSNTVLSTERTTAKVEKSLADLKALGVFPGTLEVIRPVLMSDEGRGFNVTLSEEAEDGTKTETKRSLAEIMVDVFTSIPEAHRFSEDERSESNTTPTGGAVTLSVKDVEKYAKEHELEYADALIALDKEGKLTE
ncbi:MAG TPA: phage protease [Patescibacteria group bacterium]|nr:phage protease [Patescibacteria group bacterium]